MAIASRYECSTLPADRACSTLTAPGSERETRAVVRMWVAGLLLPCVVWCVWSRDGVEPADMHILWITRSSRIGVAFSIYRVAKEDVIRKHCVAALICVFFLIWIIVMVLECINCSAFDPDYPIPASCMGYVEQLLFTVCRFLVIPPHVAS